MRGQQWPHRRLRGRLVTLALAVLVFDVVGTLLMYALEHDVARSGFHGLYGAWFWTTCQLLTVSSQLPNPVTTAGRAVDVVLELLAITIFSSLAASLGSFFVHVAEEERRGARPPHA
jgi:Na+/H+ antiporter NhaD/arsenite permease-like protein